MGCGSVDPPWVVHSAALEMACLGNITAEGDIPCSVLPMQDTKATLLRSPGLVSTIKTPHNNNSNNTPAPNESPAQTAVKISRGCKKQSLYVAP